ncbi:MAG: mucoidy inhibitor MuiA family protein [Candidatus Jordarchaeales archaeon]
MAVKKVSTELKEVSFFRNFATVKRHFTVELGEGPAVLLIEGIEKESTIIPGSVRVFSKRGVAVTGVNVKSAVVGVEEVEAEKQTILERLRDAEDKLKLLEGEVEGLRKLIDSLDRAVKKGIEAFSTVALSGDGGEKLSNFLSEVSRRRREIVSEIIKKEREISVLGDEIKRLNVLLEGEKERALELGAIELAVSCERGGKYEFNVHYDVRDAGWMPVYDVTLGKEEANVDFYAEIMQNVGIPWENVTAVIHGRAVLRAWKPKPEPWFIDAVRPTPSPSPATLFKGVGAQPKEVKEEVEAVEKEMLAPAFKRAEAVEGGLAFQISSKGSFVPGRPTLLLIERFSMNAETFYVWDAYTSPGFVELVKIKNESFPLPPGVCRVFKGDTMVGVSELPYMALGQTIELPASWEERLECERKMTIREEEKKGVVKGKTTITYGYSIKVRNHLGEEVNAVIYDRIPVPRDPEIIVELISSTPPPSERSETGILKWEAKLKPEQELKINYKFTVSYPPSYEVWPLP